MRSIPQIVHSLKTNRNEFGYLFLQAQENKPRDERMHFESISAGIADNASAFRSALEFASAKGFLIDFMNAAADSNLEDGSIAKDVVEQLAVSGNSALQAITNQAAGFTIPAKKAVGIINGSKWTGKVLINGAPMGSGILIGPNLFLTAWHVVQSLFDVSPLPGPLTYMPRRYVPPQKCPLVIQFDDGLNLTGGFQMPKAIEAHQDWYIGHSPCHPDELINQLPNPKTGLDGYWDYAIIRLANPCGYERRWVALDKRSIVPKQNSDVIIFQHPGGLNLKMDERQITNINPPDPAIPRLRFLHTVNASGGSSGAPCFDKEFSFIGIHQGVWSNLATGVINRAIPIGNIIDHINGNLPVPDPKDCPVWKTDKDELIIGCDHFVSEIWEMAITGNRRLLYIKGYPKTGKTFLINVANTLLPDTDHFKIILRSEEISKLKPVHLAKRICDIAGVDIPEFASLEDYNSTVAAWLRDELISKVIAAIDIKRNNRTVWFCITDLNLFNIEDNNTSDMLFLLYEQLLSRPWLRIILDGMQMQVPQSVNAYVSSYTTRNMIKDDIANCLTRLFSEINNVVGLAASPQLAAFLFSKYEQQNNNDPASAMSSLAGESEALVNSFLKTN